MTGEAPEGAAPPRSGLEATLRAGRFAVTAELAPPLGPDTSAIRRHARQLKGHVDALNLTDNPSATVRMASWAACAAVLEEGAEPIFQLQCRDRNRIALQADLLGASALGIRNVLLLTGDHTRFGDQPEAKGVFDFDSTQLVWTAATMRDEGTLLSGRVMKARPNWLIGAVENPSAPPREFRAQRLAKKVAAGAEFIQTQYVFDVGIFARFMAEVVDRGLTERCGVLAGLGPVRSLRALDHLANNVPGIFVPDVVRRRLQSAPESGVEEAGLDLCAELIAAVRQIPGVSGIHVMAYGLEDAIPEILSRAGVEPRQPAAANPSGAAANGESTKS